VDERWDRVSELYHAALERSPDLRDSFLQQMCAGDEPLRAEIEQLLRYDAKAESFLESPIPPQRTFEVTRTMAMSDRRVGRYDLGIRLGAGGMGEVYLATDSHLCRQVALKLLLPEMSSHPNSRARFLREARSAAALSHPNIAAIFDAGESDGRLYLAMEFVQGKSLRSILQNGPLPENEIIQFAMQLASALDHAHSRGILHRDIKPENILIDTTGMAKLVDFGIAKTFSAETGAEAEITRPGMFVGTLKYAPPEILSGQPASRRSDLYSLGLTLFETACARTPFDGLPGMAAIAAILHGDRVAVRDFNAALSDGMAYIVERSLARTPEDRFSSAAEMLEAVRMVRETGGAAPGPAVEASRIPTLALLEFANLSRDPSLDWLAIGMVEAMEGELRKLAGLQVASRARTQQLIRGLRLNLEEPGAIATIGRRLGAKWIITGSYQRSGNRIRVIPAVYDLVAGHTLPIERVDGAWEDLFDVQDRVVSGLKHALQFESSPTVQAASAAVASLDAFEHYSLGRQFQQQMNRDSLAHAKEHFEKAIALDPNYALAYAGLGSVHALTFIQTSNPEEMQRARPHLERAIALDPELGEPYPWLCYLYFRMGEPVKALAAGEQGVFRQADLAQAHYFYASASLASIEVGLGNYQRAMDGLIRSLILDPRIAAQWIVAGTGALDAGRYDEASRLLEAAWQLERNPNAPFRFVGARTLMGFVHTRRLAWGAARQCHQESLESLREARHVYRDVFRTSSACGLGEIELRIHRPDEALAHFRHAWRLLKEEPRMLGNIRLAIRTQAGMATCYAALGERDRAEQYLAEAASRIHSIKPSSSVMAAFLPHLHYVVAVAQQSLGLTADAITSLSHAIDTGWSDPDWLERDPVWDPLGEHTDYRRLVERVRLIPPVTIDLSRILFPESATSNTGSSPPS
jgi:TolB-like protein/Tfp pilus assembly protein PilF